MSWKDMTARNITEWYLYGENEKAPTGDGFLDAKYIRSGKPNDGDNPAFTIEFTSVVVIFQIPQTQTFRRNVQTMHNA